MGVAILQKEGLSKHSIRVRLGERQRESGRWIAVTITGSEVAAVGGAHSLCAVRRCNTSTQWETVAMDY